MSNIRNYIVSLIRFLPEDRSRVFTSQAEWNPGIHDPDVTAQPPTSLLGLRHLRAYLLAWLLFVMILLTATGLVLLLVVNPAGSMRRGEYVGLILVLLALFGIAYVLNRSGYYRLAASLTILCAVCGPWGSLLVDPTVRHGDFVPLAYVLIPILLSSLLLHPLLTGFLALAQLIALTLIARLNPADPINWPSLLALIFFTSVLSILANLISQQDRERIEQQREQLQLNAAQQIDLVTMQTQLLDEAKKRIKQLTVLHEVAAVATQVDSIDGLIERTTDIICNNLFPDNCGILLLDEQTGILQPHASYHFTFDQHLAPYAIPLGQGITGQVAQTGQPIRVGNIAGIQNYQEYDRSTSSELCVPVKLQERVLGVINVESTRPEAFSADDEQLLGTLAGQLATALEQFRATAAEHRWLGQLAHANELIRALSRITTEMQKVFTQAEIIQTLGTELTKIGVTCAMAVCDQDQGSLVIQYTSMSLESREQVENNIGAPFLGYTVPLDRLRSTGKAEDFTKPSAHRYAEGQIHLFFAGTGESAHVDDASKHDAGPDTPLFRLPLVFEETLLGVLWIWSTSLTDPDLPVMSNFALQIANALKRAQLFKEIQDLALTDPLTGLQNRRSLFNLGRVELARAQRMDRPFCCLMLDLDHFKLINDTHGHSTGDLVLQEFAKRCERTLRAADLIGRYGGEEIVIFLPETDLATAMQVAERMRETVATLPVHVSDQELHITVSIGVSRRDENTTELETLIARADQAMYVAKYKGRNQVASSF